MKAIAWFILTAITVPVISWAAIQIYEHNTRITVNEQRYINIDKNISELKAGQNRIENYIINKK